MVVIMRSRCWRRLPLSNSLDLLWWLSVCLSSVCTYVVLSTEESWNSVLQRVQNTLRNGIKLTEFSRNFCVNAVSLENLRTIVNLLENLTAVWGDTYASRDYSINYGEAKRQATWPDLATRTDPGPIDWSTLNEVNSSHFLSPYFHYATCWSWDMIKSICSSMLYTLWAPRALFKTLKAL